MVRRQLVISILIFAVTAPLLSQSGETPPEGTAIDEPLPEDPFADPLFSDPFTVDESEDDVFDPFADPFATTEDPFAAPPTNEPGGTDPGDADLFTLDDLDSLFATDEIIDDAAEPSEGADSPESSLLVQEGVRWGGRIRGSVSADYSWDDVWTSDFGLFDPTGQSLEPSVGASLFFDARPDETFRAFGKLNIDTTTDGGFDITGFTFDAGNLDESSLPEGWTSEENADGDTEIRDDTGALIITIPAADDTAEEEPVEDTGSTGTPPGLEVSVFELFADYVWSDRLFFRFGKHTIKWGTGYFFSPADVLNLTAVDAEDPTADREGPVSLRTQYPFGLTGNAYLYAIVNSGAEPKDIAIAPKIEFAVGNGELAFGAYYQRTLAPRIVALYSASIGEVDVFGETVLLAGSDRVFVRASRDQSAATDDPDDDLDIVLDTYEVGDALFAQATAGFRYLKDWEDALSLVVVGQYFFNGEGYSGANPDLLPAAARLLANPGENGLVIENAEEQPDGYEDPPALGFADLTNWGRHYAGLTVSLSNILDSDVSLSAFGLVNLSDWSGIVTPAVSYSFLDRFAISASARFTFGPETGEFTDPGAVLTAEPAEPTFGFTLSLTMPGGAF